MNVVEVARLPVTLGSLARPTSVFDPNPKRHGHVALIPTRRVSEGFCGIVRPSLTLRVVMFPLPAANP